MNQFNTPDSGLEELQQMAHDDAAAAALIEGAACAVAGALLALMAYLTLIY